MRALALALVLVAPLALADQGATLCRQNGDCDLNRLSVQRAVVKGSLTVSGSLSLSTLSVGTLTMTGTLTAVDVNSSGTLTLSKTSGNSLVADTNTLVVDPVNHRVGILTTGPSSSLHIAGDGTANGNLRIQAGSSSTHRGTIRFVNHLGNDAFTIGEGNSGLSSPYNGTFYFFSNELAGTGKDFIFAGSTLGELLRIGINGTVTSSQASGSDALKLSTGARLHVGGGTNDYLYSDGASVNTPGNLIAGGNLYTNSGSFLQGTSGLDLEVRPRVTNGSTAVAFKVYNQNSLTTAGAILQQWYQDSGAATPVADIDKDGAITLNKSGATRPACSSALRGKVWHTQASSLTADDISVCMKNAADAYVWQQLNN